MAGRQPLHAWIREALTDPDKEGPCKQLLLVHLTGMREIEIHRVLAGRIQSGDDKKLADLFQGKAEAYAQDLPGVQTFNLLAFYGESNEPQGRRPFMVNSSTELAGLGTEPPTEQGRTMQEMRWKEAWQQQIFRRQAQLDDYSLRLIESLSGSLRQAHIELNDAAGVVRDAVLAQADNEQKHLMERLKYERDTKLYGQIASFAPALLNTITGREIFPQGIADTALIETIAEKMTEADWGKIAAIGLPPAILGPLAARFEQYLAKKRTQEAEYKRLTEGGEPELQ